MGNYLKMTDKRRILALLELGWSYRRIERETGVRRETVARYDPRRQSNAANLSTGSESKREDEPMRLPPSRSARRLVFGVRGSGTELVDSAPPELRPGPAARIEYGFTLRRRACRVLPRFFRRCRGSLCCERQECSSELCAKLAKTRSNWW